MDDLPRYAREGWEGITEGDRERLKWLGVFFRRQTPGHFMMRVRISNGKSNSAQFRALAHIGQEHGKGFVDITTRQQIQLRWFTIRSRSADMGPPGRSGTGLFADGNGQHQERCGLPVSRTHTQ